VEAYACGLPVLASDIGSLGELVDHRETGYLATPGDAADLARTVADAFAAPQDLQRLSHSARRRYEEKYTPKENLRQLLAIYEEAKQEMVSRQVSR
jgi:glycosyltransferase involved in cell wall biosynthesis